jgi:uncharacterized membrane protein YedE/YeeE
LPVSLAAFLLGLVFGAVVQRTHFCTMGAIADLVLFGGRQRLRAWVLAIAVALVGTQALAVTGLVPLEAAHYRAGGLAWLGALLGGAAFGFGTVLAGGCVSRNLVRLGAGSLKSLVVILVVGLVAAASLAAAAALPDGLDPARLGFAGQGLDGLLAIALRAPPAPVTLVLTAGLAGLALWYCLKDGRFRAAPRELSAGLVLGALVPLGWLATARLGAAEAVPLDSLNYVAPLGQTPLRLVGLTASPIGFAAALVLGTLAGAFLAALGRRELRLESFTSGDDLRRHLAGAVLMGVGGMLAGGCSIGQGITGVSTLAMGSFLALGGIGLGTVWALDYLESGRVLAWPRRCGHAVARSVAPDARPPVPSGHGRVPLAPPGDGAGIGRPAE